MYNLKTQASFDSAHFLYGYEGKCSNIHGHRWTIVVMAGAKELISEGTKRGMVVDFKDLKNDLKDIADFYDHSLIYETNSLKEKTKEALKEENFRMIEVPFRPTAENFAKHFYDMLEDKGYTLQYVRVYETPNNCAEYTK